MFEIKCGDCLDKLKEIPDGTIQTCVTSPPYWGLRDYGNPDQLGLEPTPEEYVANMVDVFREVKRVLRDDGTVWMNLGDTYSAHKDCKSVGQTLAKGTSREDAHCIEKGKSSSRNSKVLKSVGLKNKDLVGIPWLVAFALRADGWYLRQDIIWHKPNPMPESVTDRCTKAHEYIFLLTKSAKYYYDAEAVKESTDREGGKPRVFGAKKQEGTLRNDVGMEFVDNGTRNKRSVWTVTTQPYPGAHFATFPPKLIEPCILAGSSYKACEVCGGAWERVTERNRMARNELEKGDPRYKPNTYKGAYADINGKGDAGYTEVTTTGWQPTCNCEQNGTGKSIVLDPFAGSGTTLMVAEDNGRDSIGIELSEEYSKLIAERMSEIQPKLFY